MRASILHARSLPLVSSLPPPSPCACTSPECSCPPRPQQRLSYNHASLPRPAPISFWYRDRVGVAAAAAAAGSIPYYEAKPSQAKTRAKVRRSPLSAGEVLEYQREQDEEEKKEKKKKKEVSAPPSSRPSSHPRDLRHQDWKKEQRKKRHIHKRSRRLSADHNAPLPPTATAAAMQGTNPAGTSLLLAAGPREPRARLEIRVRELSGVMCASGRPDRQKGFCRCRVNKVGRSTERKKN